jgi:hypothetical protein
LNLIISVNYVKLDNKFIDKALTMVSDDNKEISKLDQYSDVFRQATEYNFDNTPYSPDALLYHFTIFNNF